MSIEILGQTINAVHPLAEREWEAMSQCWSPVNFKRKQIMTAAGETERYLYFVTEGVQRAFYSGENNKEATIVFTYPYSFSGIVDSFLLQKPSNYFLETLTQSSFLRASHEDIFALVDEYPNIERWMRIAISYTLAGTIQRQIELSCFSAEEKFRALLKRSPHVLQLIPHKYLASYLGIDATTFSKLLGSVKL